MFICDAAAVTSHEVTPEGFLRVRARIARTGLHDYRAAELGSPPGFAPDALVRVYRPADEVFDPRSMDSFRSKPVTDEHPPEMVDARNWRRFAIGHAGGEVTREGNHLVADLLISDAAGTERALAGAELSNGYVADFEFGQGETPEGEPYDAIQRNIRGNHIALVEAGRCGVSCRIGDSSVQDCGCPSHPDDGSAALQRRLDDREREHARALDAKDGEIAALRAQLPEPVVLDRLVAERFDAIEAARRVFGPSFDPAREGTSEIRRRVVGEVLGPERVCDRGDAYVAAAFDAIASRRLTLNPLATHLAAAARDHAGSREASRTARDRFLSHAWKGDLQGEA